MYWSARTGGSWLASAEASPGAAHGQRLKPEGLVRGEEEGRVLQMHVGTSGPSMALAALEVHDLLGDSSRDGGGEAALAGRDAGEVRRVAPAVRCYASLTIWEDMEAAEAWCVELGPRTKRGKTGADVPTPCIMMITAPTVHPPPRCR